VPGPGERAADLVRHEGHRRRNRCGAFISRPPRLRPHRRWRGVQRC
jgi:hypothetical protein